MARMQIQKRNSIFQILAAVLVVLFFRIFYVDIYRNIQDKLEFRAVDHLSLFFENTWAILLTFGLDTFLVLYISKRLSYIDKSSRRLWIDLGLVFAVSFVGLIPMYLPQIVHSGLTEADKWTIMFSYLALLLINMVYISILDMTVFFRQSRKSIANERAKKDDAQFRYALLKAQLNPHFLFNSLNILDYLVQNGEKVRASEFIRKLANVYRYFLHIDEQDLVTIQTEREFIETYIDLLHERYAEGLHVDIDIPEEFSQTNIIPLSLQILVENAIQHNVVNQAHPLTIGIGFENNRIYVRNNLQPRTSLASNGIGLRNLQEQYLNKSGLPIEIVKTDSMFTVYLPLL
ncbi:MAG TPA: hypothetical protein DIW30_01590 [Bacteroidales bacterium]|nr:hypothetical protein [Bacteroidales bacterium]